MATPKRVSAYNQAVREAQTQPQSDVVAEPTTITPPYTPPPTQAEPQPPAKKQKPELERISLYVYPEQRKKINRLLRQYEADTEERIDQQAILRWIINCADMDTVYRGEAIEKGDDQ